MVSVRDSCGQKHLGHLQHLLGHSDQCVVVPVERDVPWDGCQQVQFVRVLIVVLAGQSRHRTCHPHAGRGMAEASQLRRGDNGTLEGDVAALACLSLLCSLGKMACEPCLCDAPEGLDALVHLDTVHDSTFAETHDAKQTCATSECDGGMLWWGGGAVRKLTYSSCCVTLVVACVVLTFHSHVGRGSNPHPQSLRCLFEA